MSDTMEGKVALVTGGASGIGQEAAVLFARRGAKVAVADRNAEGGAETVARIEAEGGQGQFFATDVTDEDQVAALVASVVSAFGQLDYAFNNAGITHPSRLFHELTLEQWDEMITVNLTSVFLCMKHEIIQMLAQGGGAIVNTASGAAIIPAPGQPHYTAAKRGVLGLTTYAADELNNKGIRVNAICPGMIDTPMVASWRESSPEMAEAVIQMMPGGRLGQPEEVAEAAVWLCSDEARWVSGDTMLVDGGMLNR
ncbi:MAG: glucose 1-dehydrogenase [Acidimicrobiia bacterium]|nr:glucose 1-dehydrogenase [bacterium]MXZ76947.1 glucose 1-dehydrogenase [Acidimicrobiia bacterium]MXZ86158.1 glucose 1-dehydrogenase [Acidimicrobiia bacterium]MYB08692.1 glucose 1-dehydrogenase [Acidimicrobiia bacterium]MYE73811.1 glucose 1-dehydrogenase [Acidimicrobiia bacterium]